ncbi:NAD(P)/FAD-dependent oxidoreductase [Wenzhouxiangella sp. AB-CW3]|uniref:NAD(P)/FAD-dependent oxidoreductase n=1 Tax=Wenzhouxiangella sp. AB-CW3 TaxID=2771012 RepID=UPI001CC2CFAF|nr:FAD/NAD(P)-binding oxidoreductase [Wenzhouxiangella sp. AB-CW3]
MKRKDPCHLHTDNAPMDPSRRRLLKAAGLGIGSMSLAGSGILASRPAQALETSARIVIVGAGAAGLAAANRLSSALDGARITLIDRRERHLYQPGLTLVATGLWKPGQVIDRNQRYVQRGVDWVHASVSEFNPEANRVVTDTGDTIDYDYLIVTTGLHVDFDAVEGMSPDLIGREGIGCVYDTPEHATRTWDMIDRFIDQGGVGLFTRGPGGIKCAGAPLKVTMLTEDLATRRGQREPTAMIYNSPGPGLFSQPDIDQFLKEEFPRRDIDINWHHRLVGIEPEQHRATFATPEGEVRLDYDFIHVVPPMRAPDALGNSPLAWQDGEFAADGNWMEVDRHSMQHPRFPNVFGAGDCVGTPIGKTAASVKAQVPVAVDNLLSLIAGSEPTARYNGYTSCPLITTRGQAILVEFDYNLDMVPSFPFISPYREHWVPWIMKDKFLKAAYNAMLRGRV